MIENFVVHNRLYRENLARIDAATFRGALTWFPMVTASQLLGCCAGLPGCRRR
jgi:hypothetical protein